MQINSEIQGLLAYSSDLRESADALQATLKTFSEQLQTTLSELSSNASTTTNSTTSASTAEADTAERVTASVLELLLANQSSTSTSTAQTTPTSTSAGESVEPIAVEESQSTAQALAPGESGASLPTNYVNSSLYDEWLSRKPELSGDAISYGKAITAWQESNPFYVNPKNYDSFDTYLGAVTNATASGNTAAENDTARYQSFMESYYGPSTTSNPWGNAVTQPTAEEISNWPETVQALYRQTQAAHSSAAALKLDGLARSTN